MDKAMSDSKGSKGTAALAELLKKGGSEGNTFYAKYLAEIDISFPGARLSSGSGRKRR